MPVHNLILLTCINAGFSTIFASTDYKNIPNYMEIDWKAKAKQLLKAELVRRNITYEELVERLSMIGVEETKSSIDSKMSRGSFSATFMIQCLTSIGCDQLSIDSVIQVERSTALVQEPEIKYETSKYFKMYYDKDGVRYIDIDGLENKSLEGNKIISLFSGAGGLDIGLEQAGFETAICVENDADCRATLKHNRPEWKLFDKSERFDQGKLETREPGNIREIDVDELLDYAELEKGEAALVVGGAPCQPFSNIGKRNGKDDKKNGDLFLEFVRFVKGTEPKAFIFENVAGITQSKHNSVIKYMIDSFSGSGYNISYNILNSADFGVPQRRERFFLIGIKNYELPAFPLPTHSKDNKSWQNFIAGLNEKPSYIPKAWKSVRDAFNELPNDYKKREDFAVMNCTAKVVHRMTFIEQGENFKVLPMDLRPNCWKNGKHQGQDTFGRLVYDLPSVTIRTAAYNPSKGRYIHPLENRGLNTIEMAALQDFPKDWCFKCHNKNKITLVSGGKQIGNAVPPGLARALGIAIKHQIILSETKESSEKSHELVE